MLPTPAFLRSRDTDLDGLKVRKPPGKPPKLSNERHQEFRALLDQSNAR